MQSQKPKKVFVPGDLVFAKIRGYAAWPARVEKIYTTSKNPKQTRYQVFFYWSYQTAMCYGKDMFDFRAKKEKLGKSSAYGFAEAMWEIENKPDITFDARSSTTTAANSGVSKSKDSAVSKSKDSAVSKSKDSAVSKSKVSAVPKSKDSAVSKSKDSAVPKSKDSAVQKSKDSAVPKSKDSVASSPPSLAQNKRKSSESTEVHSSKQQKLGNNTNQQNLQLVKPCFVRLEHLDLKALFASKSSTPAPKTASDIVKSFCTTPLVLKPIPQYTKSKINVKSCTPSSEVSKPTPQENMNKIGMQSCSASPVVSKPTQQNSKSNIDVKFCTPSLLVSKSTPLESKSKIAEKSSSSSSEVMKPPQEKKSKINVKSSSSSSVVLKPIPQEKKSKTDEPEKSTGKSMLTCIFCDKTYLVFNQLFAHVRRIHGHYPFCRSCEQFFVSESELKNHNHGGGISDKPARLAQDAFNCTFCQKSFETVSQVKYHMVLNHPKASNMFLTEKEHHYLEMLKLVRNFFFKQSKNVVFHCVGCKLDASPKDYFDSHIELSPHPNNNNCFICDTNSESPQQYLEHLKTHCNDSFALKQCVACQSMFVNGPNQTAHLLNMHSTVANVSVSHGERKSPLDIPEVECEEVASVEFEEVASVECEEVASVECEEVASVECEEVASVECEEVASVVDQGPGKEKPTSTDVDSEATELYMNIYDDNKEVSMNEDIPFIDLDEPENNDCESEPQDADSLDTENQTQNETSFLAAQENTKNLIGMQKNQSQGDFRVHCSACNSDIPDDIYFDFNTHYNDCIIYKELKCPFCGLDILEKEKNLHDFFSHLGNHIMRGMRTVECKKCSVSFFNLYNQTIHMVNVHNNKAYENVKCSSVGETNSPDNSAETSAEVVPPRLRSGIKFKFEKALRELVEFSDTQLQTNNKDEMFNIFCISCSTDVPFKNYFTDHIKNCDPLCVFCGKKFGFKNKYPIHFLNHIKNHLAKPFDVYTCECKLFFMNMYNGILHTSHHRHLYRQQETTDS